MIVSQHTPNSSANCDTGRSSAPTRRPAAAPVRRCAGAAVNTTWASKNSSGSVHYATALVELEGCRV
jgi:hypothetical protein